MSDLFIRSVTCWNIVAYDLDMYTVLFDLRLTGIDFHAVEYGKRRYQIGD
jgi:hypothetical protein